MNNQELTRAERKWLAELQEVLNRCPSKRIAFYTIGDPFVGIHDATREQEIDDYLEKNGGEWGGAAQMIGADFGGAGLSFLMRSTVRRGNEDE